MLGENPRPSVQQIYTDVDHSLIRMILHEIKLDLIASPTITESK